MNQKESVCMQSDKGDPFCKFTSLLITYNGHFGGYWGLLNFVVVSLLKIVFHYLHSTLNYSASLGVLLCMWVTEQMQRSRTLAVFMFVSVVRFCRSGSTQERGRKNLSLAFNRYKHKFSSHNDFPITCSQLTVWQHWPVYYSVGLYHVALPLIPWKAWKSQTTEMLISPNWKREEIKRQSCKK